MTQSPIRAHEDALRKIFSDDYVFTIPEYQRPYSWTVDEAGALFDDIADAWADAEDSYFLGSLVLIKNDNSPVADVVDGQQRLTTLTLLLAALRDAAGDEVRGHIQRLIAEQPDPITGAEGRNRLSLRSRDNDFFENYFQAGIRAINAETLPDERRLSDPQRNLRANALLFVSKLTDWTPEAARDLAGFIAQNCFVVVVTTSNDETAFRIFSVLNDRGLDLSATDIIKARVLGRLGPDYADCAEIWETLEETLGRAHFLELFAHLRMWRQKTKLRRVLHQEFLEAWRPEDQPAAFINGTLSDAADAFAWIRGDRSVRPDLESVRSHLIHLNRLDNSDWVSVALAFTILDGTDPQRFFSRLERLAYSLFLRRANVNERINRYAGVLTELDQGKRPDRAGGTLDLTDQERVETRDKLDGPIYRVQRVRMPVLLRLDSLLADAAGPYDNRTVSVEHVLPRNPSPDSEWIASFPDIDERMYWCDRIANLVLLPRAKNSKASNYPFDRKKKEYFMRSSVSTFAITSQVLNATTWTPAVLATRQEALVDKLAELWDLT